VKDLKEYGKVQRAILGIRIAKLSDRIARDMGLGSPEGVLVEEVFQNSAAFDAGLKSRDVIVGINNVRVRSIPELQEIVALYRPGNAIQVDYYRKGKRYTSTVVLKDLENRTSTPVALRSDDLIQDLGFELSELSDRDLRRLPINGGVKVESIIDGSIIEGTNMDPGFIITEVNEIERGQGDNVRKLNQYKVETVDDLIGALSRVNSGVVLLEGIYENYPGEWGYTFDIK
jgi:serine protease Do